MLGLDETPAVQSARCLDEAGLLVDSQGSTGKPSRDLLRAGRAADAQQRPAGVDSPNGRWFILRRNVSSRSSGMGGIGNDEMGPTQTSTTNADLASHGVTVLEVEHDALVAEKLSG